MPLLWWCYVKHKTCYNFIGTTVDRQCGSGQQAIHFAAQAVMSGTQDVVIAGGVEMMSILAIGDAIGNGKNRPSNQ